MCIKAFLQMVSSPEYLAVHHEREQGLERAVLYATTPSYHAVVDCPEWEI